MLAVAGNMFPGVDMILVIAMVIDLEFVFRVAYLEEVLAGVWACATIGRTPSTGAEVNACGLPAELSSPSEEPSNCC